MAKTEQLNQVLAVEKGAKNRAENTFTALHRSLQQPTLLEGLSRTYQPRKEGDEVFPPEKKLVQFRTEDQLKGLVTALTDLFDVTAKRDRTNCEAFADIEIDGRVLVEKVPATHLLFIEKKLTDLITFIKKLATLDPAEEWLRDDATGLWKTPPTKQFKTRKVTGWDVVVQAQGAHPAQIKETSRDEIAGEWTTVKSSGALPAERVSEMLARAERLQRAVKYARERANSTPVVDLRTGEKVLGYVFDA
jgi:hypothetical protein